MIKYFSEKHTSLFNSSPNCWQIQTPDVDHTALTGPKNEHGQFKTNCENQSFGSKNCVLKLSKKQSLLIIKPEFSVTSSN